MMEISKETVGRITAEEFMDLTQEQQSDVLFLMTDMQRKLLKVRLTTWESRRIQDAFRKKRQSYLGQVTTTSEECKGVYRIDEAYVLSGTHPVEIARRIRELCCKKVSQVASRDDINPEVELDRLARYDRDATLVSNMTSTNEAVQYLYERGYRQN